MTAPERLKAAYLVARNALLAERVPEGHWVGELSTSALSTATAVMALHLVNPFEHRERIDAGLKWLADHQNPDGGFGDTVKSFSNISTSMLCRAAFKLCGEKNHTDTIVRLEEYLSLKAGAMPERRAAAIRARYGKDHTFSVPILMTCALAGLVKWDEVPRLPFEAAYLPQSWYRFAKMPVVSYALPALIAIGQCIHHHRRSWNPIRNVVRRFVRGRTLNVLRRIQPTSGGYLEATPLTSFVTMALASIRRRRSAAEQTVIDEGVRFIVNSVRPDGSWPIDSNLSIWVTTLSMNALLAHPDHGFVGDERLVLSRWLLAQQYKERHPYTGAAPGGWGWTHLPGSVPDCDDTPGAIIACESLGYSYYPIRAMNWLLSLQNNDGGWPTFCRGWGVLPFDRSGADLTAHALRALAVWAARQGDEVEDGEPLPSRWTGKYEEDFQTLQAYHGMLSWKTYDKVVARGLEYLTNQQRPDGSWLPLWFGNQHAPDDINPVYGTARVLAAYRDLGLAESPECRRGVEFLLSVQNSDGGWGGAKDCPSSVEETALAVEVLQDLVPLPSPLAGEGGESSSRVRGERHASEELRGTADVSAPSPGGGSATPAAQSRLSPPPSPARGEGEEQIRRGVAWLVEAVESGRFREPSPIGFYFAKLWYFEKLYPLIFTVAALGRATRLVAPRTI